MTPSVFDYLRALVGVVSAVIAGIAAGAVGYFTVLFLFPNDATLAAYSAALLFLLITSLCIFAIMAASARSEVRSCTQQGVSPLGQRLSAILVAVFFICNICLVDILGGRRVLQITVGVALVLPWLLCIQLLRKAARRANVGEEMTREEDGG